MALQKISGSKEPNRDISVDLKGNQSNPAPIATPKQGQAMDNRQPNRKISDGLQGTLTAPATPSSLVNKKQGKLQKVKLKWDSSLSGHGV